MPRARRATHLAAASQPLLFLCILCIAFASPVLATASGQEGFKLDEDDRWVSEGTPDPASPEGRLLTARRELAAGRPERARNLATNWIDQYPDDPRLAEAYLVRADALLAMGDDYQALYDYELIARRYTGSEAFVTALEREFEIAKMYASGLKRKLWGLRIVKAYDDAEELFIRIQERLPGSRLAEEAGMALADFYFARREMELAAEMYDIFIENFPRSEQIPKARRRLIYAYLASFKGPEFDATGLYEARARLRSLIVVDPLTAREIGAEALLVRIDESDARKMLTTAQWYMRVQDPIAAELILRRLLRLYPRSLAAAEGLRLAASIVDRLPPTVQAAAPDYAAIAGALYGTEEAEPAVPDASVEPDALEIPPLPDALGAPAEPDAITPAEPGDAPAEPIP